MEKPNLDHMWETFIRISAEEASSGKHISVIRLKIYPVVSRLQDKGKINWYCFLIHNRNGGVPTSPNDDNLYFHMRFGLKPGVTEEDFRHSLPDYCVMTRNIRRESVAVIAGIDKSILRNEQIEEAWRIIGETSELVLDMLNIHKGDIHIPAKQIGQFLHFLANMTGCAIR